MITTAYDLDQLLRSAWWLEPPIHVICRPARRGARGTDMEVIGLLTGVDFSSEYLRLAVPRPDWGVISIVPAGPPSAVALRTVDFRRWSPERFPQLLVYDGDLELLEQVSRVVSIDDHEVPPIWAVIAVGEACTPEEMVTD